MAYQVTFTLNSAYTGTTEADNFTIIGKHANGSPSDTIIATNVTKANLTAGVTYQVADTVTGGTVTSTGVCTNSVPWTGLSIEPDRDDPTPTPTATGPKDPKDPEEPGDIFYLFHHCGGGDPLFTTFGVSKSKLITAGMVNPNPLAGDTVTISGGPNAGAVWEFRNALADKDDGVTVLTYNVETCDNPV